MVTASVAAIPTTPNFDGAQVRTFCSSPPKNALLLSLLFFMQKSQYKKNVGYINQEKKGGLGGWVGHRGQGNAQRVGEENKTGQTA